MVSNSEMTLLMSLELAFCLWLNCVKLGSLYLLRYSVPFAFRPGSDITVTSALMSLTCYIRRACDASTFVVKNCLLNALLPIGFCEC